MKVGNMNVTSPVSLYFHCTVVCFKDVDGTNFFMWKVLLSGLQMKNAV